MADVNFRERFNACVPPWYQFVFEQMVPRRADGSWELEEVYLAKANEQLSAALSVAQTHDITTDESIILAFVADGLDAIGRRWFNLMSPFDQPGLPGPIPFGTLVGAVAHSVRTARAFAGNHIYNMPRPTQSGASGSGGWSFPT